MTDSNTPQQMDIAVVGPGAIGTAVAGGLIEAGHAPTLCVRSDAFDEIVVDHPAGQVRSGVQVRTSPDSCEPAQVVFLAVKAHQSTAARPWLDALVGDATTLVVLQNGVSHRERIEPLVPDTAQVVPAIVNLPAQRSAPGVVAVGGRSRLTFDASPGAVDAAALFDGSFVSARAVDDWLTPAWTKLVLNAASGGVCTLTRTDNLVFHDPEARRLAVAIMHEVAAVGRAEGAELAVDLPDRIIDGMLERASGHKASIVVDRIAGRPTEWQVRNEAVVQIAERHGIDVPLNRMVTTLIRLGEPPAG